METLGDADTLEAQSRAILMENDIQDKEFSDEVRDIKTLSRFLSSHLFRPFNVYH